MAQSCVATAEVVATALEAFLNTAAVHLGEALPDGRRVTYPDAQEAWLALYAAGALIDQLGPSMRAEFHEIFADRALELATRFAARHPLPGAVPPAPVADLSALLDAAWAAVDGVKPVARPQTGRLGTGPLGNRPGTGQLSHKPGSGPLPPPPRGTGPLPRRPG